MDPDDIPDVLEGLDDDVLRPAPEPIEEPEPVLGPEPDPGGRPGADPIDVGGLDGLDLSGLDDWRAPEHPEQPTEPPVAPGVPGAPASEVPPPSAVPTGAPVDLDLDAPIEPPPSPEGPTGDEIDLSMDSPLPGADDSTDPADPDTTDELVELGADDLRLGEEAVPEPYPVADGNAWLSPGLLAAGAVAIGLSVPAVLRRRTTPTDFAALLDDLGIDARVEHSDALGLQELLEEGRTVLLSTDGTAGLDAAAVLRLTAVDLGAGELTTEDDRGRRSTVQLDRFERAWADSAHQIVCATGEHGRVALVPVELSTDDVAPAR